MILLSTACCCGAGGGTPTPNCQGVFDCPDGIPNYLIDPITASRFAASAPDDKTVVTNSAAGVGTASYNNPPDYQYDVEWLCTNTIAEPKLLGYHPNDGQAWQFVLVTVEITPTLINPSVLTLLYEAPRGYITETDCPPSGFYPLVGWSGSDDGGTGWLDVGDCPNYDSLIRPSTCLVSAGNCNVTIV